MAKQKGIINLEGKAGSLTFYKTRDGYAARPAGGINGDRIKTDAAFVRTRENYQEFGRAGKAGKLLRTALRNLIANIVDSRVTSRLTTEFLKVIKTDLVHDRGARTVTAGDLSTLVSFEFNDNAPLTQSMLVPFTALLDRTSSTGTIMIPAFIPRNMISSPKGATHYRFLTGIVSINFEEETYLTNLQVEAAQPLVTTEVADTALTLSLPVSAGNDPMFLVLGIEFLQVVNAKEYPLKNGANNAMALVQVSQAAAV